MFQEKFDGLKDLYVYGVSELKVVRILVEVVNIKDKWISGVSDEGIHVVFPVFYVRDIETEAGKVLSDLIAVERAKLDALDS